MSNLRSVILFLLIIPTVGPVFSQRDNSGRDMSQSPFFSVAGKRGNAERLPLLSTMAEVNIAGVIADVKVTQVYVNRSKEAIEATYIFPASNRAAVYAMQFVLGKRIVKAQIKEKQKAFQTYNQAKSEGKTASLLQQQRPNIFQMNLANIMPGDTIKVEMFYTELLLNENGVYEFVYPTVVGPRYESDNTSDTESATNKVSPSYTKENKAPAYLFDIKTKLNSGVPVQDVLCASHEVDINFNGNSEVQINLKNSEKLRGNKDFILTYRLTGEKIQDGLLLYEDEKDLSARVSVKAENYFLMMLQPPKVVTEKDLPGREYIFIQDVSGSQEGFPLETSKKLMEKLLTDLRPVDEFNVLVFNESAAFLSDKSLTATPENTRKAVDFVKSQSAGGGTEMLSALRKAMTLQRSANFSRTFVITTDGFVTVEKETFDYIKNNLNDANFFAFGIGTNVNRYIIEGIAHAGMGEPFVVTGPYEADSAADNFRKYISNPLLTNIKVNYEGFNAYDIVPLNVPDVFSERPIVVFGKYRGKASGKITVTGTNATGKYSSTLSVSQNKSSKENKALKFLWARQKLRGYDFAGKIGNDVKKEMTQLGLDYNLLTNYTSFVAVDNTIRRNKKTTTDSIVQPLPLPEGVKGNAITLNGQKKNRYKITTESADENISYLESVEVANHSDTLRLSGEVAQLVQTTKGVHGSAITKEDDIKRLTNSYSKQKLSENSTVLYDKNGDDSENTRNEYSDSKEALNSKETTVLSIAEIMPHFPGGDDSLNKFLKSNIKYPDSAKEKRTTGIVYLNFVVGKDGTITNVKIIKSPYKIFSDEALRVMNLMPKWIPGKQNGKAVSVRYTLPVKFTP